MKERFRKQFWLSSSIIALAIVVGVVAIYILSDMVTADAGQIVKEKNSIAGESVAVGVLADLEAQAPKAAVYAAQINNLLPTHDALFGFSSWLSGIGQAHHVTVAVSFTGTNVTAIASTPGTDSFAMNVDGNAP